MKIKDIPKIDKKIIKRLQKICACCGKAIRVIVYSKNNYRGGHFFGKIPTRSKPEYWECSGCYWGKNK